MRQAWHPCSLGIHPPTAVPSHPAREQPPARTLRHRRLQLLVRGHIHNVGVPEGARLRQQRALHLLQQPLHVRHKGGRLQRHPKLLALLARHVAARHHAAALLHVARAHLRARGGRWGLVRRRATHKAPWAAPPPTRSLRQASRLCGTPRIRARPQQQQQQPRQPRQ